MRVRVPLGRFWSVGQKEKSRASQARRTGSIPVRISVCVAQMAEQRIVVPLVAGSSPVMHLACISGGKEYACGLSPHAGMDCGFKSLLMHFSPHSSGDRIPGYEPGAAGSIPAVEIHVGMAQWKTRDTQNIFPAGSNPASDTMPVYPKGTGACPRSRWRAACGFESRRRHYKKRGKQSLFFLCFQLCTANLFSM